ncbi:MAG: peptide-methionine (S)-S-oxide reductase MsrA [Parcubacteria group bacterium]|jgi:peptide-methionine (S)-S-oxide reductase
MKNREGTGNKSQFQEAALGGGCFWCIEAFFLRLKGIHKVISGYAGGNPSFDGKKPTYEEVCSGKTGHAEVVKVEYDPGVVSYQDLLNVFFAMHDPTTLNRQGSDTGTQYRSIILYGNENQKKEAEKFIGNLEKEKIFENPIVTEIKPLKEFHPAEEYHQKYFENNALRPYCQINISPKIAKLRGKFQDLLKD